MCLLSEKDNSSPAIHIHSGVHLEMAQSLPLLAQSTLDTGGVNLADALAKLSLCLFSPNFTPRIQGLSGQENQHNKYTSSWSNYISTYTPLLLTKLIYDSVFTVWRVLG